MSKTFQLENGITYTEGDSFFKGVPLQNEDGDIDYSTGEAVDNQMSVVLVPVDGNKLIPVDHRMFSNLWTNLMDELEALTEGDVDEKD